MPYEMFWIGLSDQENEGDFRWVNGDQASFTDQSFWAQNSPGGGANDDCGAAHFGDVHPKVVDVQCSSLFFAVCEKRI